MCRLTGDGIKKANVFDEVCVVDYLPTISALLQLPIDRTSVDGKVMDVFENKTEETVVFQNE